MAYEVIRQPVTSKDVQIIRQNALAHADAHYLGQSPGEADYFAYAERCEKWVLRGMLD